jgi:TetR/AcrR family transcriptional regulator, transcriptional repressor for nem operon
MRYGAANASLEAIVTSYLCPDHRDNLSEGCLIAALGTELARSDDKTRAVATAGFLKFVDLIAEQYRRTKPKTAKARALVAASAMIGAVMISRIVTDPELSAAILHHTKKHVLNL